MGLTIGLDNVPQVPATGDSSPRSSPALAPSGRSTKVKNKVPKASSRSIRQLISLAGISCELNSGDKWFF